MSTTLSRGLLGVSSHTIRVSGVEVRRERADRVVRQVHPARVDAQVAQHPLEHPVRAAVDVVRDEHPLAAAHQLRDGRRGRRAARERQPVLAALERRDRSLQPRPRRVAGACVLPAASRPPDPVLGERAGLVDGRRDRARQLIGLLAGVDRERARAPGRSGCGCLRTWPAMVRGRVGPADGRRSRCYDGQAGRPGGGWGAIGNRSPHASMSHPLVTVIGAGNVGATTAQRIAEAGLADVVLVDIVEGLPQGKALDLAEAAPVLGHDCAVTGHQRLRGHGRVGRHRGHLRPGAPAGHEPRRPAGQERGHRARVVSQAAAASPDAIIIVVTNPLDAMCHVALEASGFPPERVIGMAGVLDSARFRSFIAAGAGCLGHQHPRLRAGRPRRHDGAAAALLDGRRRAHHGAADPRAHRGPRRPDPQRRRRGRGAAQDRQRLLRAGRIRVPDGRCHPQRPAHDPALRRATSTGQFGVDGLYVGVPVRLGRSGIEEIIDHRAHRGRAGGVRRIGGRGPGPRHAHGRSSQPPRPAG